MTARNYPHRHPNEAQEPDLQPAQAEQPDNTVTPMVICAGQENKRAVVVHDECESDGHSRRRRPAFGRENEDDEGEDDAEVETSSTSSSESSLTCEDATSPNVPKPGAPIDLTNRVGSDIDMSPESQDSDFPLPEDFGTIETPPPRTIPKSDSSLTPPVNRNGPNYNRRLTRNARSRSPRPKGRRKNQGLRSPYPRPALSPADEGKSMVISTALNDVLTSPTAGGGTPPAHHRGTLNKRPPDFRRRRRRAASLSSLPITHFFAHNGL